jgi:hypothetical protein
MKWACLIALGGTVLFLAGCGPSALQQRACDLFVDAGGAREHDHAYWVKVYSDQLIKPKEGGVAARKLADMAVVFFKREKTKIAASVATRLSMSVREVDEALLKCVAK